MQTQQQKIEAMRQEAAKRGVILPPLPTCRALWCAACNSLQKYWKEKLGEKVIIK